MSSKDYILPSSESESRRLERQAALYGGTDFLEPFLARAPRTVLDVGCGTGYFTRHVADRLPESQVTGLDMDGERLAFARTLCDASNVRFERAELSSLPFEDDLFDLVFSRFVLVHTKDPTGALREMARVTRPGGNVVAYDMVHDGIWFSPEKPAFTAVLRAAIALLRERGMEPNQGLYLASSMIRAGLVDVEARVVPHHALASDPRFEPCRSAWLDTVTGLAEILGARVDEELIQDARAELEERAADQFLLELTVVAFGTKSA